MPTLRIHTNNNHNYRRMIMYTDQYFDLTGLWHQKVKELSARVKAIARGDMDAYQDAVLGIRDGLIRDPNATDSYLLQAARFAAQNARNRGKSVDNGSKHPVTKVLSDGTVKVYKKEMRRIPLDVLGAERHSPPTDELALDRICADQFRDALEPDESDWVDASIHCLEGRHSESRARRELNVDRQDYDRLRRSTHGKFRSIFGT
jgi:hypothetical protein